MITIYVTYNGDTNTHFDRDYYVRKHLPLVRKAWSELGLISTRAFFPAESATGTIAICECQFRDDAAYDAALSCAATSTVMADVAHFTNALPERRRLTPF